MVVTVLLSSLYIFINPVRAHPIFCVFVFRNLYPYLLSQVPAYLSICPINPFSSVSFYLSIYIPIFLSIIYLHIYLINYLFFCLYVCQSFPLFLCIIYRSLLFHRFVYMPFMFCKNPSSDHRQIMFSVCSLTF